VGSPPARWDALVAALGVQSGISRSQVSRALQEPGYSYLVPPTATAVWTSPCGSARGLSWWKGVSTPTAAVSCLASKWATARTRGSGANSPLGERGRVPDRIVRAEAHIPVKEPLIPSFLSSCATLLDSA
jgi:hypothetical protein